jgi:EmrB/QacA subfamily drug resistance transporter
MPSSPVPSSQGFAGVRSSESAELTERSQVEREVRRSQVAFIVILLAVLVVSMDNSILYVALKTLAAARPKGLGASQSELQWAVDAYVLAYAGLLLTSGVAGNRFGHRRLVLIGLAGFGAFSVASALAPGPGWLIAFRAAMGAFAALMMPATLAIVTNIFPGRARVRAIGIWSAVVGAALAIGPVIAGALLSRFWWGSVFLVNVPVVALAIVAIPRLVPEFRESKRREFDPTGALLATTGLIGVVFGAIRAGDRDSWLTAETLLPIAAGLILLTGFARRELSARHPALDVRYFADRGFTVAVIALALLFFALFGGTFVMTFYLQTIRGYSALHTGLCILPLAAALIVFAPRVPGVAARFGTRVVAGLGMMMDTAALFALAALGRTTSIWWFEAELFAFGTGMALVLPPMTARIVATLPQDEAGTSSAVNNTFRQVGGSLGIAVLGSILTSSYKANVAPTLTTLPPALRAQAGSSITATQEILSRFPGGAHGLLGAAFTSFMGAMHTTWTIGAVTTLVGAAIVFVLFPRTPRAGGAC